jgi:hypothetical protein
LFLVVFWNYCVLATFPIPPSVFILICMNILWGSFVLSLARQVLRYSLYVIWINMNFTWWCSCCIFYFILFFFCFSFFHLKICLSLFQGLGAVKAGTWCWPSRIFKNWCFHYCISVPTDGQELINAFWKIIDCVCFEYHNLDKKLMCCPSFLVDPVHE